MGGWSDKNMNSKNNYIVKFTMEIIILFQNTMTDSTILLEDVQKMKDKGEIAQAYIGLKETNRYKFSFFNPRSVGAWSSKLCISYSVSCIHVSLDT